MFEKIEKKESRARLLMLVFLVPLFIVAFFIVPAFAPQIKAAVKKGKVTFEEITVGGVNIGKAVMAVGSIQQSILTETDFQSQMGTDWVAMKGQAIAGSKLCTEYSICTLPDARNRFLRNSDASDTNLRGLVSDTTAKNGLALTGNVSGGTASLTGTTTYVTGVNDHDDINIAHGHEFTQPSDHSSINIAHGHEFTQPSDHSSINIAHGHGFTNPKVPAHYHGAGTLATNSTTSVGSSTHTHGSSGLQAEIVVSGGLAMVTGTFSACTIETNRSISGTVSTATQEPGFCTPIRGSTDGPSTPTVSLNNIDIDGSVGFTSGCNGDLGTTCTTTGGAVTALPETNKPISSHVGGAVTALPETNKSISAHSTNTSSVGINSTAANNGDLAIDTGDSETAPNHIIVNTFVKIN